MTPTEGVTFDDMTVGDCQLDGVFIPCSMALRSLGSGAANVDWNQTDRAALSRLGVTAIWNPNSGRAAPDLPSAPSGVIRVNLQQDGGVWEYYISKTSWDLQRPPRGPSEPVDLVSVEGFCWSIKDLLGYLSGYMKEAFNLT